MSSGRANYYHRYVWFQMHTHHGLYDSVFEKDEERDLDGHLDLLKDKLTLTESVVALVLALTCVSMHAVFLGKYHSYALIRKLFIICIMAFLELLTRELSPLIDCYPCTRLMHSKYS